MAWSIHRKIRHEIVPVPHAYSERALFGIYWFRDRILRPIAGTRRHAFRLGRAAQWLDASLLACLVHAGVRLGLSIDRTDSGLRRSISAGHSDQYSPSRLLAWH